MTTQMDQDLQNRARDASGAIGDGSALSSTPALAGALAELVSRVEAARLEHAAAVAAADRDATENRLAALALGEAASKAIGIYRHVGAMARLRLVDLDPSETSELGAIEVERRRRLYESAFATAPSELGRLGRVNVMTALQATVDRLADADELPKSDRKRLADAVVATGAKHTAVREESRDDAIVADRLLATRSELERQTASLLTVAAGVLRAERSVQTLERLLQTARTRRTGSAAATGEPSPPATAPTAAPQEPESEPEPAV